MKGGEKIFTIVDVENTFEATRKTERHTKTSEDIIIESQPPRCKRAVYNFNLSKATRCLKLSKDAGKLQTRTNFFFGLGFGGGSGLGATGFL